MSYKTILVLEERFDDARVIADTLSKIGHRVCRVSAAAALCGADSLKPDLVIADVSRSASPTLRVAQTLGWVDAVPIVIATSLPYVELDEPLSQIPGVWGVVFKPCSDRTLVRTVEEALAPGSMMCQGASVSESREGKP